MICECCGHVEIADPIHIYDPIIDGMCHDCVVLCQAAIDAISIARRVGVPVYGPDTWKDVEGNTEHALTHIVKHRRDDTDSDRDWETIAA